jgi:hypothetical protein
MPRPVHVAIVFITSHTKMVPSKAPSNWPLLSVVPLVEYEGVLGTFGHS